MLSKQDQRPVEILLVEDNIAEAALISELLKENRFVSQLHHVRDGVDALRFLRQENVYSQMQKPDIVLLDLRLPGMDGLDVLRAIKQEPTWRRTPVIVLSTSASKEAVSRSYDNHANAYIIKPMDPEKYGTMLQLFLDFWVKVACLPGG